MLTPYRRHMGLLVIAAAIILLPAAHLFAGIEENKRMEGSPQAQASTPGRNSAQAGGLPPYHAEDASLQLDCWQKGVKIVGERRLNGISSSVLSDGRQSLTFDDPERGGELSVISLGTAFCLVKGE